MKRVLFICGKARMRSPSAADVAAELWDVQADFAGLSNDADEMLSLEQIEWADKIFVMENRHRKRLVSLFGAALKNHKVINLDIPDKYAYMDPDLVELLALRLKAHLENA